MTTLIIPGLKASGPSHWQTWLEQRIPDAVRVVQADWHDANLQDWSARVRRDISRSPGRVFIVAHSFGVLAAVQAAYDHSERIAGALLVAPAEPDKFSVADLLPQSPLVFPTLVVASATDTWMSLERAAFWADRWGAQLVNLGDAGHINTESGFGPWPQGLALLRNLKRNDQNRRDALQITDPISPDTRLTEAALLLRQAGWSVRAPEAQAA